MLRHSFLMVKTCEFDLTLIWQSSRRINYKVLVKDCLSIMCGLGQFNSELSDDLKPFYSSAANSSQNVNPAIAIALPEVRCSTCAAMQKLLTVVSCSKCCSLEGFPKSSFYKF